MAIASNFPSINPTLMLDFANSGRVDPRVTFTRASSATFFDQTGVLRTAATNVPRLDYNPSTLAAQGFLIEESRTNSIRNNTMQGAAAGTPGTLPTNWAQSSLGTLTQEVVGTGTENGIAYLDIRYSGTTSNTLITLQFDANTQIAALQNQTWTSSLWIKVAAGSQTDITSISNRIREIDSGGTAVATGTQAITVTSSLTRNTFTRTLTNASTAFIANQIAIAFVSGVAIDITLRIGLPQLELGAFATSVIPTTSAAVTRAADVASVNTLSPWYNASEGTLYAEGTYVETVTSRPLASINAGNTNELISVQTNPTTSTTARGAVNAGGVAQATLNGPASSITAGVITKMAIAYKVNDFAFSVGGSSPATDTSGNLPTVDRLTIGTTSTNYSVAYIRRITYYPRRLSNSELQALTA